MRTYKVTFDSHTVVDKARLANYVVVIDANDRDDAQEKAVDACEAAGVQHGNIVAIEALDCE